MADVLVVDDNRELRESLVRILEARGLEAESVGDGFKALARLERSCPAVVVLDILMPQMSGLELLRIMRERGMDVPVLLLTDFGGSSDRAVAIEQGADDYLNKPFDPAEVAARVRALMRRRQSGGTRSEIVCGAVTFDMKRFEAYGHGRELVLTPKAKRLLLALLSRPNELLTRRHLLEEVWGFGMPVESRSLDQRIAEIRKVLKSAGVANPSIVTLTETGYRLDVHGPS